MPDTFTTTSTRNWGSRIMNSIKGVLFGILLFLGSFAVLYWNEGRVDLSNIARTAVEISSGTQNQDAGLNGKFVSTTGELTSPETLGDGLFLKAGEYIALSRKVETYAWVEHKTEKSKVNVGGSETVETTYDYKKEWTESPQSSDNFKIPEGHKNPQKTIQSGTYKVKSAKVGVYSVDVSGAQLPNFSRVSLSRENTILSRGAVFSGDSHLFIGKGSAEEPQVGDLRVSFSALSSGANVTAFGKLDGTSIVSYLDKDNNKIYRIFSGTRDEAIGTLKTEYTLITWILRLVGFLMMWFGLMLLVEPLSVILDFLPIFGTISRTTLGIAAFLIALILSIVTILISMILHNLIALIVSLAVVMGAVIFWLKRRKSRPAIAA